MHRLRETTAARKVAPRSESDRGAAIMTKHTLTTEIAAVLKFYRDAAERVNDQPTEEPTKAQEGTAPQQAVPRMMPGVRVAPRIEHDLIAIRARDGFDCACTLVPAVMPRVNRALGAA